MTTITINATANTTASETINNLFYTADIKGLIENTRNLYSLKNNGTLSTDLLSYDDLFQNLFFYINCYDSAFNIKVTIDRLQRQADKLMTDLELVEDTETQANIILKAQGKYRKIEFLSNYSSSELETGMAFGILKSSLYLVIDKMTHEYKTQIGIDTDFSNIINSALKYKASSSISGVMNKNCNESIITANDQFYKEVCKALNLKGMDKDIIRYNRINSYKPSDEDIKTGVKPFYYLTFEQLASYKGYALSTLWRHSTKLNDALKTYLSDKHFSNN